MLTFDNGSYDACAVLLPLKNSLSNGLLPAVVLRTCLSQLHLLLSPSMNTVQLSTSFAALSHSF